MLRRSLIPILAGAFVRGSGSLDPYLDSAGTAVLLDVRSRRLIASGGKAKAGRLLVPPGSTLKPLVLALLLRAGRLRPDETLPCPGRLRIAGHSLDCVHPRLDMPMRAETALAYSCNCFVGEVVRRLAPGAIERELARLGLASSTGLLGSEEAVAHLASPASPDAQVLQALGVEGVAVTTAQLAVAYSGLARASSRPEMAPVVAGLEGAVAFGTAQRARVAGWAVAGKTGSVLAANGMSGAWFAGFAPSRAPVVALAVLVHGRSGGADAAPVAARILDAWRRGRI